MNIKKAFTLLELIVVIVIISILGTFGFVQYQNMLEKARAVEARIALRYMKNFAVAYYLERGSFPTEDSDLWCDEFDIDLRGAPGTKSYPNHWYGCRADQYFSYDVADISNPSLVIIRAWRCDGLEPVYRGKPPSDPRGCIIGLEVNGPTGTSSWYYQERLGNCERNIYK